MFVAVGTIIVDDIVTSDGRTILGVLGGSATHAVAGMRVWSREVGLAGTVGRNFPEEHWRFLETLGIDSRGIRRLDLATPRAWQIFDEREHRTEIFSSPEAEFPRFLPTPDQIAPYRDALGFYLMSGEPPSVPAMAAALRAVPGAVTLWEPAPWCMDTQRREEVFTLLGQFDIFSPNLEESVALLGYRPAEACVDAFIEAGATVVAVRMGREGSVVRARFDPHPAHVPVVPAPLVDVTGAGNAYCGGFLVGYVRTGNTREAGLYGAIAASYAIRQIGPPLIDDAIEGEAGQLLTRYRAQTG